MNTLENKAKFFAQYWGQTVFFSMLFSTIVRCESYYLHKDNIQETDYLLLKPLSSITDEDAIGVAKIIGWGATDYLRSKGYALPWMGLSVETLIEYGWIKLKEGTNG